MGAVSEYLATIEGADREALERVYSIAREVVAEADEGTSYGMPALLFHGKGLITTLKTRKHLSLYPYSGAVVSAVVGDLPQFEATSGAIHYSAEHQLPDAALRRIVTLRRAEIQAQAAHRRR